MYSTDRLPDFDGVAWALRFAPEDKLNTHWIPVRLPLNLKNAAFMIDVTKLADPRDCHVDGYGLCNSVVFTDIVMQVRGAPPTASTTCTTWIA